MNKLLAFGLTVFLLLPILAQAQNAATPSEGAVPMINELINKSCPGIVAGFVGGDNLVPVLRSRPIETPRVCACASTAFMGDPYLLRAFKDAANFPTSGPSRQHLDAYIFLRLMHSVMTCLAPEMDQAMAKSISAK